MLRAVEAACPYCRERVEIYVDESGGLDQGYVEDCPVCCRPWQVRVVWSGDAEWEVVLRTTDE